MADPLSQLDELTTGRCPSCNTPGDPNQKFCSKCGACMSCGTHAERHGTHEEAHARRRVAAKVDLSAPTRGLKTLPLPEPPPPHAPPTPPRPARSWVASVNRRTLWQVLTLWLIWVTVGVLILSVGVRPPANSVDVRSQLVPTPEPTATPAPTPDSAPTPAEGTVLTVKDEDRHTMDLVGGTGQIMGKAEIMLLDDANVWVQGMDDEIMGVGKITGRGRAIFSSSLVNDIVGSPEVVIIATADKKGTRAREEGRTDTRGLNLEREIVSFKGTSRDVSFVPLGQWVQTLDDRCRDTGMDTQRRIVLIRVLSRDKNQPLGPALREAVTRLQNEHDVYKDIVLCYSKSNDFTVH